MNDTKPFSITDAKAGAPYGCRNGKSATILKWDAQNRTFPLVGTFILSDDNEQPESWTISGEYAVGDAESGADLVMLPLGHIDGKPVFAGDELEYTSSGARFFAEPDDKNFVHCRWPKPAKQYPETQMTREQLIEVVRGTPGCFGESYEAVANSALRHAFDNGYAATKEAYDQCNTELAEAEALLEALGCTRVTDGKESGWTEPDRAARDLAIAEAVFDYCLGFVGGGHFLTKDSPAAKFAAECTRDMKANTKLHDIIATVKP